MSILMSIYIVFVCQRSAIVSIVNGQLYFISFRLRRCVLRLRFSYGYGYDLVITAPSLRLRHLRYGYDIIVTATTSSLLLRPLEAYIYDFYDIN